MFSCSDSYEASNVIDMSTRKPVEEKITRRHLAPKSRILPRRKSPEEEAYQLESAEEFATEPIKSLEDINAICDHLLKEGRYRDYMLFVVGINFGLRTKDLVRLRFCHILNDDLTFRETLDFVESKTAKSRKHKINRHIAINDAVIHAVSTYLANVPDVHLDDLMFHSNSNRGKNVDKGLTTKSVYRILKGVVQELGLPYQHIGAHTLRKTFAYHQMAMSNHDPRKLLLLQKMYGHSDTKITMRYIGLTHDEIDNAYLNLNLGLDAYSDSSVDASPQDDRKVSSV